MTYEEERKSYFLDIVIPESAQFLFIVNGIYTTSSYYPMIQVRYSMA
jgi:hypothetical protein